MISIWEVESEDGEVKKIKIQKKYEVADERREVWAKAWYLFDGPLTIRRIQ